MRILLIEDSKDLALNISEYFESKGHIMDYSADGLTAVNLLQTQDYDVVVLDIMLPGMDGFTLCQKFRQEMQKDTPVIMLTAKDTENDKLEGFNSGADDYLIKPFSLPELDARLNALTRRNRNLLLNSKKLRVDDLVYDQKTLELYRNDKKIFLKPVPKKILVYLMRNSHRVVTRREIEQEIWGDNPPNSEVMRTHIYTIRHAIEKQGLNILLHTIHGVGYRLAITES
jgi:DNA-binding response OmpR family regulator